MPESFDLDHTKVVAPYVRFAGRTFIAGGKGCITKFDMRFTQPNKEIIDTDALHTVEHLLATYMRNHITGVIDISPMGCRTGFYLIVSGRHKVDAVRRALRLSFKDILAHKGKIPGCSVYECGNYTDHSLPKAQRLIEYVLTKPLRKQLNVPISAEIRERLSL